jgi:hypothetical protein
MAGHSRSIGFLLDSLKDLVAINVQVRQLLAVQHALAPALPAELARQVQVVSEDQGVLTLAAPNSAAAAKLRQLAPRVIDALARQKFHIRRVRVVVQLVRRVSPPDAPPRRIPATGLHDLARLSRGVKDPGLRSALRRLIARQGGSGDQDQALEGQQCEHDQKQDDRVLEDLPGKPQPAPVTGPDEGRE